MYQLVTDASRSRIVSSVARSLSVMALLMAMLVTMTPTAVNATAVNTNFQDSTFANPDWTSILLTGGTSTFTAEQVTTGGNPGEYRRVVHHYQPSDIVVAHLRDGAVYDPATQGAIQTIDYSVSLIHFTSGQVGYNLLLLQNNTYYTGAAAYAEGGWTNHSFSGLSADSFSRYSGSGPLHPDFSATGSPIRFGYASGNSATGSGTVTRTSGIDNWSVSIAPVPDADSDGVADASDNCLSDPNSDQADTDGDGIGDACDPICEIAAAGTPHTYGSVLFPQGALSFADEVVIYAPSTSGSSLVPSNQAPSRALGAPNGGNVSLGNGGSITIKFVDNVLTGSGTTAQDLYIFEVGAAAESTTVEISTDGINWYALGQLAGATHGVDIDAFGFGPSNRFSYVRVTDVLGAQTDSGSTAGADIDAVGAISAAVSNCEESEVPIGDRVWNDLDRNGLQDAGEPGVAGVTLLLRDGDGAQIDSTTSATNGVYLFQVATSGAYTVEVAGTNFTSGSPLAGAVSTTGGEAQQKTLDGTNNLTFDFGYTFDPDADGVLNPIDNCPDVANTDQLDSDTDGQGDACEPPPDSDGDGVIDELDNCPDTPNADQADFDGDGFGDVCDSDDDNDGLDDGADNCALAANADQADLDGNGLGDACDADDDGDGISDIDDNCPTVDNGGQSDLDGDGLGDACDADDDADGVADTNDNCPVLANSDQTNLDGDGIGDACDPDDDADGVADGDDNCPAIANPDQADNDADGLGNACDPDDDNDGVTDGADNCQSIANGDQADLDGDGAGDACDADADGDGVEYVADNCPVDSNLDQADLDGDGIGDVCDPLTAPVVDAGADGTIDEATTFTAIGSFQDPNPDTWTATVDYGDGSGVQPLALTDMAFYLDHVYADNGTYVVTVTVQDDDGLASSDTLTVTVANVNPAIDSVGNSGPIDEGGSATIAVSADDVAGSNDPLTYAFDCGNDGVYETSTGSCAFADEGSFVVGVSVSDDDGGTAFGTTTVVVNNVAPAIGQITAPIDPIQVGASMTTSVSFSDPGVLDTHTAVWNWGDGTSSNGAVTEANGEGTVTDSHAYAAAGVYTVTVTIDDGDGGVSAAVYLYVVVYDPNGGFVTGGGWIDSPPGAYAADPNLTGKASFGFVAKYKKGANVPDGNTSFQFKAGGLSFESFRYDWLVIAGSQAKFKGNGTINDQGNYGFMLTAIDGTLKGDGIDQFRIKIWDIATGEIVYDNKMGSPDDADDATALGGGSVVIHTAK